MHLFFFIFIFFFFEKVLPCCELTTEWSGRDIVSAYITWLGEEAERRLRMLAQEWLVTTCGWLLAESRIFFLRDNEQFCCLLMDINRCATVNARRANMLTCASVAYSMAPLSVHSRTWLHVCVVMCLSCQFYASCFNVDTHFLNM